MTSPLNPWKSLGRQQKLALARRDVHAIRIHLDHLPHAVSADVLARADKYARDANRERDVNLAMCDQRKRGQP